jgi:DNA polymerase-3 subunit chi
MTRIDFYILPDTELPARDHFACRLLHKVCRRGMRAYLHCDSEESAHRLDELLWSFRDTSFLPHKLAGSAGAPCAIEIGYGNDPGDHHDLLVNLAYAIPILFFGVRPGRRNCHTGTGGSRGHPHPLPAIPTQAIPAAEARPAYSTAAISGIIAASANLHLPP